MAPQATTRERIVAVLSHGEWRSFSAIMVAAACGASAARDAITILRRRTGDRDPMLDMRTRDGLREYRLVPAEADEHGALPYDPARDLAAPHTPMGRAQAIVQAVHGPVPSCGRRAHAECSRLARHFAGLPEVPVPSERAA